MRRLLRANMRRLWKSVWFWFGMAATMAWALFALGCECYNLIMFEAGLGTGAADSIILDALGITDYAIAVFVSMYIGTEYSNKTMRNKIIVGHSKTSVYFSNLITCSIGALMMYVLHFVIFTVGGLALLGPFRMPKETLICFLCGLAGTVAITSVFVLAAMLITSKSVCVVITVLAAYYMMIFASYLNYRASQPPTFVEEEYNWETGEVIGTEIVDNPDYIENESLREFAAFLYEFFPQGQAQVYGFIDNKGMPEHIGMYPIYSLLFTGIFTSSGVLAFRKKDLK